MSIEFVPTVNITLEEAPDEGEVLIALRGDTLLLAGGESGAKRLPTGADWPLPEPLRKRLVVGQLDSRRCSLVSVPPDFQLPETLEAMELRPARLLLEAADETAVCRAKELAFWRRSHRFCGGCGKPLEDHETECARRCPACGAVFYPVISPAVIVAVTDGCGRLLLAHNAKFRTRMFALLAVGICAPMAAAGVGWLYYLVMGLIAVLLGAFGSVFSTYSSLYLSKDNDLLLSMPIPVRYVMASRLLGVYLLGLMYSGVATVPAVIVYWIVAPVTAGTVVGGVLTVLLVSVIVMVLSCLLGWVVARISLKLKNKSFITVILSLAFLAAYYFVYYKAQGLITLLAENAAVYGAKIRGSAYLLYLFGSVGAGDWLAMLIVTLTQAALLALTLWVIARSFLKIATATGSVKKVRFEHKAVRAQSVQRALRRKELRRFTASPNYMLNCGLGIVTLPVAGIALLIKGRALAQLLDDVFGAGADIVPVLLCAAVCLLASMNDMAAPSVSLEGRQLWLAQSLPVTPWQVLRAKLEMQLLLTGVPVLFCALCAVIVLPGGAAEMALAVIAALLYTLLSALAALALGLKMPNLTWTNEITPIKQGGSVMLALFVNWFYAIALGGLYFLCGRALGAAAYLAIFAAVTAVVCALLLRWLKRRGTRIFAAL